MSERYYAVSKPWFARRNMWWQLERDAFADEHDHVLPSYWTAADDAMRQDWREEKLWIHPPYDKPDLIEAILDRFLKGDVGRAVMLCPLGAVIHCYKDIARADHMRLVLASDLDPFVLEGHPDVWGHDWTPLVFVYCNIIARGL